MPTYAYACTACDNRFEVQQSFTDDTLTDCPECAGRVRKLFNSVGIVFKGSGFYRTDSRAGSGTNGAGSSADTKDKPDKAGSDKVAGSNGGSDKAGKSSDPGTAAKGSGDKSGSTASAGTGSGSSASKGSKGSSGKAAGA